MSKFGTSLLINIVGLLAGCLAWGQGLDPQNNKPPISSRLSESDDWRPLNPEPFEGCDIIINRNARTGKLTIDAVLHNRGYIALTGVIDSTVYININCVARDTGARSTAASFFPCVFDLYVIIDDCDTAQYKVAFKDDNLNVVGVKESKYVNIIPVKPLPCELCWLQFKGNHRSLNEDISRHLLRDSNLLFLEKGYYLNFPFEVKEERDKKHSYNTTQVGTIFFMQSGDVTFPNIYNLLIRKYAKSGLVAQGCVPNLKEDQIDENIMVGN